MLVLLAGLVCQIRTRQYSERWLFGLGAACFMFLVGVALTEYAWKKVRFEWPSSSRVYQGVVLESILEKQRTYQCRVRVADKDVLLYVAKDSLATTLKIGEVISFYARIESQKESEGSDGFDYDEYLYHKGISGTAYVPSRAWKKVDAPLVRTWKQEALSLREHVLEKYRLWGIGEQELPVLAALTLGYKGDLDKETRMAYSASGISHVLALSGLHVGIVWYLLNALAGMFSRRRFKWLRWLFVTIVLWGFAFVVGLEASVIRAVIMCMLMEMGRLAGVRPMSVNTLAVTAWFMLLYQPFYLFDVGFQLSFMAVLSILLFYPWIYRCVKVKNRIVRVLWGTIAVSVSAQIGTWPLVMYYFSNVSICFLLPNLLAAILLPLIIYVSVLLFLVAPVSALQVWIVKLLNGLVLALNEVAEWFGGLPFSTFSIQNLNLVEVWMFYVALALGWIYGKTRRRKWLIGMMASWVCLLALYLYSLLFL